MKTEESRHMRREPDMGLKPDNQTPWQHVDGDQTAGRPPSRCCLPCGWKVRLDAGCGHCLDRERNTGALPGALTCGLLRREAIELPDT